MSIKALFKTIYYCILIYAIFALFCGLDPKTWTLVSSVAAGFLMLWAAFICHMIYMTENESDIIDDLFDKGGK